MGKVADLNGGVPPAVEQFAERFRIYRQALLRRKVIGFSFLHNETVIMPLLKAHSIMLYRNLLYTGITRAKKRVVLIGQKQVLFMAIHRNEISKRNTLLGARIDMYFKAYARRAGIPLPNEAKKELKHAG